MPGQKNEVKYKYCVFSGGHFSRWEGDGKIERVLDFDRLDQTAVKSTADIFGVLGESTGIQAPVSTVASNSTVLSSVDVHSFKAKLFREWNRRVGKDTPITSSDGVIIVSYFLPVILTRHSYRNWSAKWDEENILSFNLNVRATWVGSVRYNNGPIPVNEEDCVTEVLLKLNCNPIFIDQNSHYQFYEIFCKQNLWLTMHHVADVYGPINVTEFGAKNQQDVWYIYSTINKIFRDKVVEAYHSNDLIWIHGFHLMLLPSFIRRRLQQAKIGYFFHTPFPSSEIWKTITRRDDLLRGILAADQIGFHLYEYARHFLIGCHRLLGYSFDANFSGVMTITIDGREVSISCIHVGVDLPKVNLCLTDTNFISNVNQWSSKFQDKIVVCGKLFCYFSMNFD